MRSGRFAYLQQPNQLLLLRVPVPHRIPGVVSHVEGHVEARVGRSNEAGQHSLEEVLDVGRVRNLRVVLAARGDRRDQTPMTDACAPAPALRLGRANRPLL